MKVIKKVMYIYILLYIINCKNIILQFKNIKLNKNKIINQFKQLKLNKKFLFKKLLKLN